MFFQKTRIDYEVQKGYLVLPSCATVLLLLFFSRVRNDADWALPATVSSYFEGKSIAGHPIDYLNSQSCINRLFLYKTESPNLT